MKKLRARLKTPNFIHLLLVTLGMAWRLASPAGASVAERSDESWQVASFIEDAELANQRILGIDFAPDGTTWVATAKGLFRYNGYEWRHCTQGLPSAYVRSVLISSQGELWVGTDRGAGVYDGEGFDDRGFGRSTVGQSIRRMVEDSDGTLWFCGDRWPDPQRPGGLSSLKEGHWKTFTVSDGLPEDHVFNYFRDAAGHRYATTRRGLVRQQGDRWEALPTSGYPENTLTWMMAQTSRGELVVQSASGLWVLQENRWNLAEPHASTLCATREGDLISCQMDLDRRRFCFTRWNGNRFVPASAQIPMPRQFAMEMIRQAPDGTLWGVGQGTIVRWEYRSRTWQHYVNLPPPRFVDAQKRVWFVGTNSFFRSQEGFTAVKGIHGPVYTNGRDDIWAFGEEGLVRMTGKDAASPIRFPGFPQRIDGYVADAQGNSWFHGTDPLASQAALMLFAGREWQAFGPPKFVARRIVSAAADPQDGVWLVVLMADRPDYALVHARTNDVRWIDLGQEKPALNEPGLCVDRRGFWLYGDSGLWRASSNDLRSWRRVDEAPHTGYHGHYSDPYTTLFSFSRGQNIEGNPGIAIFSDDRWYAFFTNFTEIVRGTPDGTILLANDDRISLWNVNRKDQLGMVSIPPEHTIVSLLQDGDGGFWVGTDDGVLFSHLPSDPPRIILQVAEPAREVNANGLLQARIKVIDKFTPLKRSMTRPFSWRFDDQAWSAFGPLPADGFPTANLAPGQAHTLEVRICDTLGDVFPETAQVSFNVLARPLQSSWWFKILAVLSVLLIGLLGWTAYRRTGQIARSNTVLRQEIDGRQRIEGELRRARDELEARVQERTAELSRINNSLKTQMAERARLEEQLRHAQKMEAVGQLAGGIAHDFNNLLTVIRGHVEMLLTAKPNPDERDESLLEIESATDRATDLTHQLLAFSRRQVLQTEVLDLNDVLADIIQFLQRLLGEQVTIQLQLSASPVIVEADRSMLEQVIVNLAVNARDAMPQGGTLTLGTDRACVTPEAARLRPEAAAGSFACLRVIDTGIGMDETTRLRIFEPFFSTKPAGKGTGLGLATAYGIVKQHRGWIEVDSQPKQGTMFRVFLPLSDRSVERPVASSTPETFKGGNETILVVEDESAVRLYVTRCLRHYGYRTLEAANGPEALEVWRTHQSGIDLLLTDLVMPQGMSGKQLAERLQADKPSLRVVYTSGYNLMAADFDLRIDEDCWYLPKPFNRDGLLRTLRQCLDAPLPG